MTEPLAAPAPSPRGGPRTPEGKARSAQNARKHGLRARDFLLSPDEDTAEWALHLSICEEGYGPTSAHERNLVCAIAAAMWNEIRADRAIAEVMARIPPPRPGDSHGTDSQEPAHALSLNTAIRYQTAAGMAVQRSQRTLFTYRNATLAGVIVPRPAPAEPVPQPAPANANCTNEPSAAGPQHKECTNEPPPGTGEPGTPEPGRGEPRMANCTNEPRRGTREPENRSNEPTPTRRLPVPEPLAALRARLDALVQRGAATGPGDHDLLAAIRALKLPDAAPYRGPIEATLLDQVLAERHFEIAGRAWLEGFAPPALAAPRA